MLNVEVPLSATGPTVAGALTAQELPETEILNVAAAPV
jgi:hypothetical protein